MRNWGSAIRIGAGLGGLIIGFVSLIYVGLYGSSTGAAVGGLGLFGLGGHSVSDWAETVKLLSWLSPLLAIVGGILCFRVPILGAISLGASAICHYEFLGASWIGILFILPLGAAAILAGFGALLNEPSALIVHKILQRIGVTVLPNHYYSSVADINRLEQTRQFWAQRAPMRGIDTDAAAQMQWLRAHVLPFQNEYRDNERFEEGSAKAYGPGFGYIEAQCLHGVIRSFKPRRIIEVGSGVSTHIMLGALAQNKQEGHDFRLTCIDPYPSAYLRNSREIELIASPVEQIDPAVFDQLEAGDLLFIDSTHAVRPGGDVVFLYLYVIPRLKPGVIIHIHDIFFPYLYRRQVLESMFQWEETSLLAALLTNNSKLKVDCCLSQLHYDDPDGLKEIFPGYRPQPQTDGLRKPGASGHFPSSLYLTSG